MRDHAGTKSTDRYADLEVINIRTIMNIMDMSLVSGNGRGRAIEGTRRRQIMTLKGEEIRTG